MTRVADLANSLFSRWSSALHLDWVVAMVVVLLHFMISEITGRFDVLGWAMPETRATFYQTASGVIGVILGFIVMGLVLFYTMESGRRLRHVRREGRALVRRVWTGSVTAPLAAVMVLLVALAIDNVDVDVAGVRWFAEAVILLVAIRLTRMVWFFSRVLDLSGEDDVEDEAPNKVKVVGPRRKTA